MSKNARKPRRLRLSYRLSPATRRKFATVLHNIAEQLGAAEVTISIGTRYGTRSYTYKRP